MMHEEEVVERRKKKVGVTRAKADRLIADLLDRVEVLNHDPDYLYRVTKVAVFGSYLSEKEKLGDLDIAVELVPKCEDHEQHWKLVNAQRISAPDHIRGNFLASMYWSQERCYRMLKNRSRAISIHGYSDLENLILDSKEPVPFAVIFPAEGAVQGAGR